MQNVHAPVEVPPQYEALYDGVIADPHRKTFAGMVSALDEAIGNLTDTLREVGMWENTLLLFNSGTHARAPRRRSWRGLPTFTRLLPALLCLLQTMEGLWAKQTTTPYVAANFPTGMVVCEFKASSPHRAAICCPPP